MIDIAGLAERLGVGERFVRRLGGGAADPVLQDRRHVRFLAQTMSSLWIRESRVEACRPVSLAVVRDAHQVVADRVGRSADG